MRIDVFSGERNVLVCLAFIVSFLFTSSVSAQKLSEDVERQVSQVLQNMGYYSQVQWCQQVIPSKVTCALGPANTGIPAGMADIYLNPQLWCIYKGLRTGVPENLLGAFDESGRAVGGTRCRR